MLDFTNVSREVRSLIGRRRELLTFLGTVFAAMGLFLQDVLQENLPPDYARIKEHGFAYYSFLLMVPGLILALRLAKLNAGMTLNGILYQRLMMEQDFRSKAPPEAMQRAAKLNPVGVGFLMSLLANLIAGFSAALLSLSLLGPKWPQWVPESLSDPRIPLVISALIGAAVVTLWLLLYVYFHNQAVRFAMNKAASDSCLPFTRNQWEEHQTGSLEDGNNDMIAILALVGLISFSSFEGLSSLGKMPEQGQAVDVSLQAVRTYGPEVYGALMAMTCLLGMVTYMRLRVAIGQRSLDLDPTDRPFRPLRLTDSLLGYMLLAFLFVVSVHFILYPFLKDQHLLLLAVDVGVFALAVLAEQITLIQAGKRFQKV
jgi:hypothetical protein